MFRRRGCLPGCGSILIICVLLGGLGWFVVLPRLADSVASNFSDSIATAISLDFTPQVSIADLQQGGDVQFSFSSLNEQLQSSDSEGNVGAIRITSFGDQMVVRLDANGQTLEYGFVPIVTEDGLLELNPVVDGGFVEERIIGIFGDGVETGFNSWLKENDLRLTDITLDGDTIILHVTGN